jgi:hypothetical protein
MNSEERHGAGSAEAGGVDKARLDPAAISASLAELRASFLRTRDAIERSLTSIRVSRKLLARIDRLLKRR